VLLGSIPYLRANLAPFVATLSMIPPMAMLPILFIVFGLGEVSKVVLIVIGITPFIIRDLQQRVRELPAEQIIKAQTLSGSSWQLMLRVILPQVLPRLLDAVRLSLGSAWLFLIAAEAIAATEALGYRIFAAPLPRHGRDPAVCGMITLLAWLTDLALHLISRRAFRGFTRRPARRMS
jgi:NitT/TauT family transport system permease protein